MGNSGSFRGKHETSDIPQIVVIQASPLPVDRSVFNLPEPQAPDGSKESEHPGSGQQSILSQEDGSVSPSGSEDGRQHFIQVTSQSSPEARRSLKLRRSRSDADSASLSSYVSEVEGTPVTLDPVEHEWMMCASDADWGSLLPLLSSDPGLVLKRDFVTGFTCLHWAAKHGKPELVVSIVDFAKENGLPISVDVRSNMGYTPLHLAAIHNHVDVLQLLTGAYNADVDIRDYSGRRACQYLPNDSSVDIRDIVGACEVPESKGADFRVKGRWRFSKVIQNDPSSGEEHPRDRLVRRRSSLSRMKPNLQRIRQRASQLVRSASFRDRREMDESEDKPSRSRPEIHFLG